MKNEEIRQIVTAIAEAASASTKNSFGIAKKRFLINSNIERLFKELNLTKSQIAIQDLPELKVSLVKIEDIINSPNELCKCLDQDIGGNDVIRVALERKRMILDRIQEISTNKKIDTLQVIATDISDGEVKRKITEELDALQEEVSKYKQDIQEITAHETEAKIKLEQQRIDGLERKSKIWLLFLQRESASSIIGGIILLMLTLSLIGGMIFGKESQILSNGFLVILGYFFGQSSSKNNQATSGQ